jgi:hypothetical protein
MPSLIVARFLLDGGYQSHAVEFTQIHSAGIATQRPRTFKSQVDSHMRFLSLVLVDDRHSDVVRCITPSQQSLLRCNISIRERSRSRNAEFVQAELTNCSFQIQHVVVLVFLDGKPENVGNLLHKCVLQRFAIFFGKIFRRNFNYSGVLSFESLSKLIRVLGVKAAITFATLARTPSLLRLFASFTERAQDTIVDDVGNPAPYLNALVSTLHLESPGVVLLLATVGIRNWSGCGGWQGRELCGVINGEARLFHVAIAESDR